MKKISERQKLLVTDLIAEKGLNISEYALEKDYIVTDALQALFKLKDPQFDFIFCGGTCFSKAYGLFVSDQLMKPPPDRKYSAKQ